MNTNQLFLLEEHLIDQEDWIFSMIQILQTNRVNWAHNKMSKYHTKHNKHNNKNFHQEGEIGELQMRLNRNQFNNQFSNLFNNNQLSSRMKFQQIIGD